MEALDVSAPEELDDLDLYRDWIDAVAAALENGWTVLCSQGVVDQF
jgi:hypothetical protein